MTAALLFADLTTFADLVTVERVFAALMLLFAMLPACVFLINRKLYLPPQDWATDASDVTRATNVADVSLPAVSVLIPARNEERAIGEAVRSVLQERTVPLELIVLDDHSSDATASVVKEIAADDDRVRVELSQPLPPGWCGKQYACWQLAALAEHDRLLFLDADVRLEPHAISRTLRHFETLRRHRVQQPVGMLSGVPRQVVGTWLEQFLIPLIHYVLLSFLPIGRMRRSAAPAYAAACGQFILVDRTSYERAGGHRAIRDSMHDGVKLPRAFRQAGIPTDLVDAVPLARCRMYRTPGEVWSGLSKNAVEGLAHPARLPFFFTALMLGQVLPFVLLPFSAWLPASVTAAAAAGVVLAWTARLLMARQFQHPLSSVVWHPVAIVLFLTIQVAALANHLRGVRPTWKGRGVSEDGGNANEMKDTNDTNEVKPRETLPAGRSCASRSVDTLPIEAITTDAVATHS